MEGLLLQLMTSFTINSAKMFVCVFMYIVAVLKKIKISILRRKCAERKIGHLFHFDLIPVQS